MVSKEWHLLLYEGVVPRKVQLYILCMCIETDRHSFFGMFGDDIFSSTKGAQGPGISQRRSNSALECALQIHLAKF